MNAQNWDELDASYRHHKAPWPWWQAGLIMLMCGVALIILMCTASEAHAWFGDVAKAIGSATEAGFEAKWKLELLRTIERNSDKLLLVFMIVAPTIIMLAVLALAAYLLKLAIKQSADGWTRKELAIFVLGALVLVSLGYPSMDFATGLAEHVKVALAVLSKGTP